MEQFYDSVILFGICQKINYLHGNLQLFGRYNRDWQYVFAALMLVVLPMLIFFIILQKHIIAGMTAGAVKG